jgi:hypothetical protein
MRRFILSAGVAALAIAAPAMAGQGGGHGGQHGGHAAKAQHGGGGHAKAQRGGGKHAKAQRGGGSKQHAQKRAHAPKQRHAQRTAHGAKQQHAQKRQHDARRMADAHRPSRSRHVEAKSHGHAPAMKMAERGRHKDRVRQVNRDRDTRVAFRDANRDRARFADRRAAERDRNVRRFASYDDDRWINRDYARNRYFADSRYINSCPPGLAAKHNGCLPPGQARQLIGNRLPAAYRDSRLPVRLRDYYRDNDDYYYRYGDGYLYRVNRQDNLVAALLPLFGSALGLGTPFPASYSNYNVPSYYQSFYPDTRDDYYRYANGNVYAIDRDTGYIEDIVPLMAGGYGVGQLLPAGYSAYNVPYQYRDYYRDSGDAYYRYAPGAIYQVDPRTNLVTSVASLLTPTGFAVGQPLPMGYGAYNVPYQYRSQYYDSPDAMYRYNNGYIYQVDPTTQLISAVIRAIV